MVAVLLSVPFAGAFKGAIDAGWNPSNDDALIALQIGDVRAGEWPRLGQPSTAEHYVAGETLRHPGPIEFYVLAIPVALVGSDVGMPLGAGLINLSAVLVGVWVVMRRAGPGVALGSAVVFSLLAWAQGPVQLVDPISSNIGGFSVLALAVLAWALVDGDERLLPLAAAVYAFVAQQHLAIFGLASGLVLWGSAGLVGAILMATHWRRRWRSVLPWAAAAVVVTLIAWLPVLVDQVAGSGNLGRILTFAGSGDRPTLGWSAGLRQTARALGIAPLVLRTDLTGDDLHAAMSPLGWLGSALVLGCLAGIIFSDRRRNMARCRLAVTVLVLAVLGLITGANVPASIEADRLNLFRWTFALASLAWLTLGWAAVEHVWVRSTQRTSAQTVGLARTRVVVGASLVVIVAVSAGAVMFSGPRTWRDGAVFSAEEQLATAMLESLETGTAERILLVPVGRSAEFAVAPALAVDLERNGYDVVVPPSQGSGFGEHRVVDASALERGAVDGAVVVVSGNGAAEKWPGTLLASVDLNAVSDQARMLLADQLRGLVLTRSERGDEVMRSLFGSEASPKAQIFGMYLAGLGSEPETILLHPYTGLALREGFFGPLDLDPVALDTLADNPPVENWLDTVIEIRFLTAAEVADNQDAVLGVGLGRPVGG